MDLKELVSLLFYFIFLNSNCLQMWKRPDIDLLCDSVFSYAFDTCSSTEPSINPTRGTASHSTTLKDSLQFSSYRIMAIYSDKKDLG